MKAGAGVRASAARVIAAVLAGSTLESAYEKEVRRVDERDRGLLREISTGTLRLYPRLDAILEQLLAKPMRKKDADVRALALAGLYQLSEMRVPPHAAVSATVDAATVLRKRQTAGLLNALLRRFQREAEALLADLPINAAHAQPAWLWDELSRHWPEHRETIAVASNEHPPMTLRVNQQCGSRDAYGALLDGAGFAWTAGSLSEDAITLEIPVDVFDLPGFGDGLCSVQDEAAQLAAVLLSPNPGERILDACAAPGGKTGHLWELCPETSITAMDISEERLVRVAENLERLGAKATLVAADGSESPESLGEDFDAMLVDVPCSATGVIRRHPDIKVLRRPTDIPGFAEQQRAILRGLWPRLREGGRLLYVTCSILPAENSDVVRAFVRETENAHHRSLMIEGATNCDPGLQVLPTLSGSDGLFFAMIEKRTENGGSIAT
ncbi:MAG: 16S rRNA (cytosine(967)-C(5))-methyltransferase RsmB [Pseudomonadota bacterium]